MSYSKQFPIRITLAGDTCDFLIESLKANEEDFVGATADDAKALREKIEKYGRHEINENGDEVVRLGFYEKEGVKFIWQFLAASKIAADYRELSGFADTVCAENSNRAESEV
jgi:hypothetical protein